MEKLPKKTIVGAKIDFVTHSYMCDLTHSYVRHDLWVKRAVYLLPDIVGGRLVFVTHSCVWHGSFMCETWLISEEGTVLLGGYD